MKIKSGVLTLTGLLEEGASEGAFKHDTRRVEYIGQIKGDKAHGWGMKKCEFEECGDWFEGNFTGFGEVLGSNGAYNCGEWEKSDRVGYGEEVTVKGTYQGYMVKGVGWHGPIRHTAPSGAVKDTI